MTQEAGSVSIVIPVYNGAQSLPELVRRIHKAMDPTGLIFEILLINDGSRDDSWGIISKLAKADQAIRGFDLLRNYGQHNALLIGIRAAAYDIIVTLDDDLQHPPEEIPLLLARIMHGCSLVYGTPEQLRHNIGRNLASRVIKSLMRHLMGMKSMTETSPFRAFRTDLRKAFNGYNGPFVDIDALLGWATAKVDCVVVHFDERHHGASAYNFSRLINHTLNMVTNFSVVPLRLANYLGLLSALFGILVLVYVIGRYFIQDINIPGFAFLGSIIAIFAGVQLFSLGIIGEYIIRIHFRTMGKPAAVVREETGQGV